MTRRVAQDFVDLDRYPIGDLASAEAAALIADYRERFHNDGILILEGFIRPGATIDLTEEARSAAPRDFARVHHRNVYMGSPDDTLPEDHARNLQVFSNRGNVSTDRIPDSGPLKTLYAWKPLRDFIGAVLDGPPLYHYGDPLASLMINVNHAGEELGWHLDNSESSVTLMLQQPERGGVFRYVSAVRTDDESEFPAVNHILDGKADDVRDLDPPPGKLVIFCGHRALHCVTSVEDDTSRLVGVLNYSHTPDERMLPFVQRMFHGREA